MTTQLDQISTIGAFPSGEPDADLLADTFARNGWVKVPGLLGEGDLERVRAVAAEAAATDAKRVSGRDGFGAETESEDYQHTMRIRSRIRDEHPVIMEIARKVAPTAANLLGVRSLRLWTDNLFIKPGREFGSRPTVWHQDSPKIPIDRRGIVNAWIAINDVPITRGAMAFASGSHRIGSLGAISQVGGDADLTELLSNRDWEQITGLASVPLQAGDATFHEGMTLHRAHANVDLPDRIGLAFHMFDADARYTGAASRHTDGLGMKSFGPFDDEAFPIIF